MKGKLSVVVYAVHDDRDCGVAQMIDRVRPPLCFHVLAHKSLNLRKFDLTITTAHRSRSSQHTRSVFLRHHRIILAHRWRTHTTTQLSSTSQGIERMYTYNSTTKMVNAGTLNMQNTNTQVQAHTQTQTRLANQSSAHLICRNSTLLLPNSNRKYVKQW